MRLLVTFIITLAALAQDQSGSIRGIVTDSVTHMPVKKATVVIEALPHAHDPITTDEGGAFLIDHLNAGSHQIWIHHPRYPQTDVGLRKTVSVKTGETTDIGIELVPGAAASGRVLDEDGDPLPACYVQAKRADGGYARIPARLSPTSADGEYRLFDLAPGKYILFVQCGAPVFQPRPLSVGPDPPPSFAYPKRYYPDASNAASAEVIELQPGAERSGLDFHMTPAAVTHIHVVLAPGDWRGRKDLTWQLIQDEQTLVALSVLSADHVDVSKGSFDIPAVFPGTYHLVISSNGDSLLGGVQEIAVADKPIDVSMTLRGGADLRGVVEAEDSAKTIPLVDMQVELDPVFGRFGNGAGQASVKDDGTFAFHSVFPGPVRLRFESPASFMKSAWLAGIDVKKGMIDLANGAPGELRIVVSANTATIRGSAPAGTTISVGEINGSSISRFRSVRATATGTFTVEGLSPGKYRIAAGDQPEELLNAGGQEVTLEEGQTLTVDLQSPSN